ncbi:hypothetical protein PC114_g13885 [Phytophthora cactorum]|nr:hypothetical protein PC114_g13885 [Phytophthora cactorum]
MRLLYLIGLTAVIYITSIDANASVTGSNDGPSRATKGVSVSAVEKLKSWFTSSNVTPQQLQSWLNEGKSADAVFTCTKLTKAGGWPFLKPQFSTWAQYVDELSAKTSQKGSSAISTLTRQYGDDKLYEMIERAKFLPETKNLATRLQADQMQHWIATRKDPDEVFRVLKLDKAGGHMLSSTAFSKWAKYVGDLNVNNLKTSMIPTLRNHFTEYTILSTITSAKSVEGTKSIASKLEDNLILAWLNSRKTPDDLRVDLDLITRRVSF